MTDWFRWWHGTATDPKFGVVSMRAGCSLPEVIAIWAVLLENASQADDRGEISGIQAEEIAWSLRVEAETVQAVLEAMVDRGLIEDDRLTGWERRQPGREDAVNPGSMTSTERSRKCRGRKREEKQEVEEIAEVAQRDATPMQRTATTMQREATPQNRTDTEKNFSLSHTAREDEPPPGTVTAPDGSVRAKIPTDFAVTKTHRDYAKAHGLPPPDDCLLQFAAHHEAKGTLSANWDAEFRKWLANEKAFRRSPPGGATDGRRPKPTTRGRHDEAGGEFGGKDYQAGATLGILADH